MDKQRLTAVLPYPVSVNNMYRAWRNRVVKSSQYRSWLKECLPIAIGALADRSFSGTYAGLASSRVRVDIAIWPPDKRARDVDNVLKSVLDCLEAANWIKDDSQVDVLTIIRKETDTKDPRVSIMMTRLTEELS